VEGIVYAVPTGAHDCLHRREGVNLSLYLPTFVDLEMDHQLVKNVLTFVVVNKEEGIAPPAHNAFEILRGAKGRVSSLYFKKLVKPLASSIYIWKNNRKG
jgi:cation transport regulator ChaC